MSEKKTLLERLRIVEKIDNNASDDTIVPQPIKEVPDVKTSVLTTNNILDDTPITDKPMSIREIYIKSGQLSDGINTIFIIENYTKALPEYLPTDIKKQSVLNLISASGLNLQNILRDGKEKLRILNIFQHNFENKTSEAITKDEAEIKLLESKIAQLRKEIERNTNLMQEQKSIVDFETQRIQNIIDFVGDKE